MGQYYRAIIGDNSGLETKVLSFHSAKLMEHSWWNEDTPNSVAEELYNSEGRVCWVGDYATENNDFCFQHTTASYIPNYAEVWGMVYPEKSDSSEFTLDKKYLVNHDTKQYIDLTEYKQNSYHEGSVIHPLPLLTAVGNDRGGGDFYDDNTGYEHVGIWAWNLLSITDAPPADYTKFNVVFKEDA